MLKPINMISNAVKPLEAILLALLMTLSSPVAAQDFQKGLTAYNAGDFATAIQEWTPLAEQGNTMAQLNIGIAYDEGLKNYAEAAQWYIPLAVQGDAEAQLRLGFLYDMGRGVRQDGAKSVQWYRLSAEQGYASGQYSLATAYQMGRGVLQDNIMAHMWLNIASANGEDIGNWFSYLQGLMTTADISKAQAMARECLSSGYQNCGY